MSSGRSLLRPYDTKRAILPLALRHSHKRERDQEERESTPYSPLPIPYSPLSANR